MTDERDLPDKASLNLTYQYSIKLGPRYRQRIAVINGYKDGLTDEIRSAIERVVDVHWEKLQSQLEMQGQAG